MAGLSSLEPTLLFITQVKREVKWPAEDHASKPPGQGFDVTLEPKS